MLSKSSVLALTALAAVAAFAGCGSKNSTGFRQQSPAKIQKGTKTTPQIASQNDQILLAFNELAWSRQTAALAVFPVSVSTQEGCVTRRPMKSGGYILREDYRCERASDESDSVADQLRMLNGQQLFTQTSGMFQAIASFSHEIWQANALVAKGDSVRNTQVSIPSGATGTTQVNDVDLKSSVFKMTAKTQYKGLAPEPVDADHVRIAEQWNSNVTSGFIFSASKPLTLLTGAQVSLSYLPETDAGTKRSAQVVQITALADIGYVESGNCLRPVGTFALSDGSTQVGTVTTSAAGYSLSTETDKLHAWGKRCLER